MLKRNARIKKLLPPLVLLLLFIGVWEVSVQYFEINKIILPAPSLIVDAFLSDYKLLFKQTAITMFEAISGFVLGVSIAYMLAIVFSASKLIENAVYPYAVALKSTPIIAIAPIIVLWAGNGIESKIIMSALVAFFPVLVNSVTGLTSVPKELNDLMKSYSASFFETLVKVRIPYSLKYLFPSLKIASSLAVVGAVIGEFVGSTMGIGNLINTSSYYLDTPLMFAAVLMISAGGILFFSFITYLEKKVIFWEEVS